MIERLRWRIGLAFERWHDRLSWQHRLVNLKAGTAVKGSAFDEFVDRLSPWVGYVGYRRVWLRRNLYRLRYWRRNLVQTGRSAALRLLAPWAKHPGRYEGNNSQLIARWLDDHAEYAEAESGETAEYGLHHMLFTGSFPWGDGWYISQEDDRGFFYVLEYESQEEVDEKWTTAQRMYNEWLSESYDMLVEPEGWIDQSTSVAAAQASDDYYDGDA